jgi:N-acetylglucosamine malate deacetylase 1
MLLTMKLDVLAIAAHPDDTELNCAGTLAALVRQGLRVGVLDLTRGEMGSRGTPEGRLTEATEAARILGLSIRENLSLPDCGLDNTPEHRLAIVRAVRKFRPDVCFINAPSDRHPDHGNASRLTTDALFFGGLSKLVSMDDNGEVQEPWRPFHTLHFMQDRPFEPDFVFDISDTIDIKEKAILAFKSQFNVHDAGDEPQTYISRPSFFESIRARAKHFGHLVGVDYGEGFLYQGKPIPLRDLILFLGSKPTR